MLRSMDSAVSGLRAHQNKLDVIGHNIANVNTNGFKSQNYTFKDTMYQTSTASTNGTNTAGGVNAAQYGYGALMGVISAAMRFGGVNLVNEAWLNNTWSEVLALGAYALLILYFIKASMKVK